MTRAFSPFVITWSDLGYIWSKYHRSMQRVAMGSACVAILVALLYPVQHTAKALFREGASSNNLSSVSLSNIFLSSINPDGSSVLVMQSEKILKRAIEKLGMQAQVQPAWPLASFWRQIDANVHFYCGKEPDEPECFSFADVSYNGLQPISLYLIFSDRENFTVHDKKGGLLATAAVNRPVILPEATFCLTKALAEVKVGKKYCLDILPWENLVAKLRKRLEIRPEKLDKSILRIFYSDLSRTEAERVVNGILDAYLCYLQEENDQVAEKQLAFLDRRQDQFVEKFDKELDEHLAFLQQNVEQLGFFEVEQELNSLNIPQQECRNRLTSIDSLYERLKKIQATSIAARNDTVQIMPVTQIEKTSGREQQFAGMDLDTAQRLHNDYQKELDTYQEKIDTISFLQGRLHRPDFDLDALATLGIDTVTSELIKNASELSLRAKDVNNYSPKDLQRIAETLNTQKAFIAGHLEQALELYRQNAKITQEKLVQLRDVMLKLIQTEKAVIYKKLLDLRQQLGELPLRWKMEQQLEMKREMLSKIVEGITHVIEGKTIEGRLKQLNSKIIDRAHCDLRPKKISLFLLFAICVGAGVGIAYSFFFSRTLLRGFPLSESTARVLEVSTGGTLGASCGRPLLQLSQNDGKVLRALANFIQGKKTATSGVVVALASREPMRFIENLAHLFHLRGLRVLVIDIALDASPPMERSSLMDYLLEKSATWLPQKIEGFDKLPCKIANLVNEELLCKERFEHLLTRARAEYDVVLIVRSGSLDTGILCSVIHKADGLIISLREESLQQLELMGGIERFQRSDSSLIIFQEG